MKSQIKYKEFLQEDKAIVDKHREFLRSQPTTGPKNDAGKQSWLAMPLVLLHPLADAFTAGSKKYALFSCLLSFEDANRRFFDAQMRHTEASQVDPLAIDNDLKDKYGVEVYHLAQVAFNALLRLHNCLREKEKEEARHGNE